MSTGSDDGSTAADDPADKGDAYWVRECIRIIDQAEQVVARGQATFLDPGNDVEFGAARMLILDLDVAAEWHSADRLPDVRRILGDYRV